MTKPGSKTSKSTSKGSKANPNKVKHAKTPTKASARSAPSATGTKKAPPGSTPRQASTSPSSKQSSKVPVTLVQVRTSTPSNDDDEHGDLTVEEGVRGDRSASIAFQSLLVTANSKLDLRMTIRNYVSQHFFKHVKFITRGKKLAYFDPNQQPNTYCAVVTKGYNLPLGTNAVQWWETLAR
jgi:hypothetical protein